MFESIQGECPYKSPTDMGVNMAGYCIVDDEVCQAARRMEILRRYYDRPVQRGPRRGRRERRAQAGACHAAGGRHAGAVPRSRGLAQKRGARPGLPAGALVLPDGRSSPARPPLCSARPPSLLLNALKGRAGSTRSLDLISSSGHRPHLQAQDREPRPSQPAPPLRRGPDRAVISALTNPIAALAQQQLGTLRGCDAHFSVSHLRGGLQPLQAARHPRQL